MDSTNLSVESQVREIAIEQGKKKNWIIGKVEKGNQYWITFNRPKQKNAFSVGMYFSMEEHLIKANQIQQVKYIILKGSGGNFSSGNDLANFMHEKLNEIEDRNAMVRSMARLMQRLTTRFVESKKPIFAIVEGLAIGFAFTELALFDRVFATSTSKFMAPLVKLAQGVEMGSSYTFPKIFGYQKTHKYLVEGQWITAQELQKEGFISVYKDGQQTVKALDEYLNKLNELDWPSYLASRRLMKEPEIPKILEASKAQVENLVERWNNPDLPSFIMNYMSKQKAKL